MSITFWNQYNGISVDADYFSLYIGTPVVIVSGVIALTVVVLRRIKKARGL